MAVDSSFWRGKRVLLTGHTGFKGGWLSLWLQSLGAELHGYALSPPSTPNLYTEARVGDGMVSTLGDVRDLEAMKAVMAAAHPEIVIHMAAQPLVRLSYDDPVGTYATNVMGTVHLLEAVRLTPGVKAVVIITTDKCYENREWVWGYREDEPMGGHDPYSSSKGCAELVTAAYRRSFFEHHGVAVASARAGNVIGGGDWAVDRIIPDFFRASALGTELMVRSPDATRPWQHVLEPLSGYLTLAERLFTGGQSFAQSWNFGPGDEDAKPVRWLLSELVGLMPGSAWQKTSEPSVHEANYLKLDSSLARSRLGWKPQWDIRRALEKTVEWQLQWTRKQDMKQASLKQISEYHAASEE